MGILYTLPFAGRSRISSAYGSRTLNGKGEFHPGWDIVGADSTDIGAPCAGTVKSSTIITGRSDLTWQWGNYVKLHDGNGLDIFHAHMDSRTVTVGQSVRAGDKLGVMGSTGYSFGAHTHWEARTAAGAVVNPGELFGLANMAGVTYDREAMDAACVGYLDCTEASYRWRKGPGTSYALYKPSNIQKSMYCREGVRYRVYGTAKDAAGQLWCQITPPASCVTGETPALWASAACGKYTEKAQPAGPELNEPAGPDGNVPGGPVDWDSACNEFLISASKGDRPALREVCDRLALPVKNA